MDCIKNNDSNKKNSRKVNEKIKCTFTGFNGFLRLLACCLAVLACPAVVQLAMCVVSKRG